MHWHHQHAQVEGRDYNIQYKIMWQDGSGYHSGTEPKDLGWFWMPDTGETRRVWMGDSWTTVAR